VALTIAEVLADVAASPGFKGLGEVTARSKGEKGESPLHWIAVLGDGLAIQLLLEAGADLTAVDDDGNTPLHTAIKWRQVAAAKALIESGASLEIRNREGLTPADMARADRFEPTISLF
jgi:ankyrin repeat protein